MTYEVMSGFGDERPDSASNVEWRPFGEFEDENEALRAARNCCDVLGQAGLGRSRPAVVEVHERESGSLIWREQISR
ncbi:MAG TPA: hypothetical protein VNT60_02560 [Deinococcales bacterium]|nr:hypothetical protein [Deinococcales bacterium]